MDNVSVEAAGIIPVKITCATIYLIDGIILGR